MILLSELSYMDWFSVSEYLEGLKDIRTAVIVLGVVMVLTLRKLTK